MRHIPTTVGIALGAILVSSCAAGTAPEREILGTITWKTGGQLPAVIPSVNFQGRFVTGPFLTDLSTPLFDTLTLSPAQAGKRISLTRQHPFFEKAVARLTNGVPEIMLLEWKWGKWHATLPAHEQAVFHSAADPGADAAGSTIERISLVVDSASFRTPAENPNRDGVWTHFRLVLRVTFEGTPARP
jgi:hypothetical protein